MPERMLGPPGSGPGDERSAHGGASPGLAADPLFVGETGALMRAIDWSATPLGPVERWPLTLRSALSVCLDSPLPMMIWWGPELVALYNDAYRPMLGSRQHPEALGRPGRECWLDVWNVIGPMLEGVLWGGKATFSDDLLLPLDRHGYREECYLTLSFSPIRDEAGRVHGVFTTAAETTRRVLGERRLRTLRDLALRAAEARTTEQACESAVRTLAANPGDIPFALLYLLAADGERAHLAGATGVSLDLLPLTVELAETEGNTTTWPLAQAARTGRAAQVNDLGARFHALPMSLWGDVPQSGLVLPVTRVGPGDVYGFLVLGISPHRALAEYYRAPLGPFAEALTPTPHAQPQRRRRGSGPGARVPAGRRERHDPVDARQPLRGPRSPRARAEAPRLHDRHQRAQADGGGARPAPGGHGARAPGGGGGQPRQGRVPGDALPRAKDAARCDSPLGEPAPRGQAGRGDHGARARDDRAGCEGPRADRGGHPGCIAHRHGRARPPGRGGRPRPDDRGGDRGPATRGRRQIHSRRVRARPFGDADLRRRGSPAAGGVESPLQRDQVHAQGRPHRGPPGTGRFVGADHGERHGTGHQARFPAPCLRALSPGRFVDHASARGPRARIGDRPSSGEAARRLRPRGQPGRRAWGDIRRQAPAAAGPTAGGGSGVAATCRRAGCRRHAHLERGARAARRGRRQHARVARYAAQTPWSACDRDRERRRGTPGARTGAPRCPRLRPRDAGRGRLCADPQGESPGPGARRTRPRRRPHRLRGHGCPCAGSVRRVRRAFAQAGGPGGADGADCAPRGARRAEGRQPTWYAHLVKGGGAAHAAPPPAAYSRLPARGGGPPLATRMGRLFEVAPRKLGRDWRTVARGHGERRRHDLPHPDQLPRDDHAEALRDADGHSRRTVLPGFDDGVAREFQDASRHAGHPAAELAGRRLRAGGRSECQNTHQQRHASQRRDARIPRASVALHRVPPLQQCCCS